MQKTKETETRPEAGWQTLEHPGFLGKYRDESAAIWNRKFGEGNWRLAWELANGEIWDYGQVFWLGFVPAYVQHFYLNHDQATFLTQNYAYVFDKDRVTKPEAFDPYALYGQPGKVNQIHHAAINITLEWYRGLPFQGRRPIQVRENMKPFTGKQPEGYLWSPGQISAVRPELIPPIEVAGQWWQRGTVADLYQTAKVLQLRTG